MSEWLASLAAGDQVVIQPGRFGERSRLARVTKITATQIVCGNERFRRTDGWELGSGYARTSIVKPTQEAMDEIEGRKLRQKIKNACDDSTTALATLRAMAAQLSKESPK